MSNLKKYQMYVKKYIPQKFYGFVVDDFGMEVFFHLKNFQSKDSTPPILGEIVLVEVDLVSNPMREKAQKATSVERVLEPPQQITGEVQSFDAERGYGFVLGENDVVYHLHKSEFVKEQLIYVGQRVHFYGGSRQEKPRACHVEVCNE